MALHVEIDRYEGYAILRPQGELDIATVGQLREAVVATIAGGCADLVVDLAGVTFIDSSGLGVVVGAMKRALQAGGRLVVTGVDKPAVSSAFRASGLSRIVRLEPSADRAVQLVQPTG